MNNSDSINRIIFLLITGLRKWSENYAALPEELKRGQMALARLCLHQNQPVPIDIPSLVRFLEQPLEEWQLDLENCLFPQDTAILARHQGLSAEALDFLQYYPSPLEIDQSEVLSILRYSRQADPPLDNLYRRIRTFLSSPGHALLTGEKLHHFMRSLADTELASKVANCYEEISDRLERYRQCPRCGWTLQYRNSRWQCGPEDLCARIESRRDPKPIPYRDETVFRLKEGVYRYTLIPGMVEHDIANRLRKQDLDVVMYPDVDRYDLIVISEEQVTYLDVKDYKNPVSLAAYFNQLPPAVLEKYREDNVYIVLPSYRKRLYRFYIRQVEKALYPEIRRVLKITDGHGILRILKGLRYEKKVSG